MLTLGNRGQYHKLPTSGTTIPKEARGISDDGSTIVGRAAVGSASRAFYWRRSEGTVLLPNYGTSIFMQANDCSANGDVICGMARIGSPQIDVPWVWSQLTGLIALGLVVGPTTYLHGEANAISDDGTVIVGAVAPNTNQSKFRACKWSASGGNPTLFAIPPDIGAGTGNENSWCNTISGNGAKAGGAYNRRVSSVDTTPPVIWDVGTLAATVLPFPAGWADFNESASVQAFTYDASIAVGRRFANNPSGLKSFGLSLDLSRNGKTIYGHNGSTNLHANDRIFKWDGAAMSVLPENVFSVSWRAATGSTPKQLCKTIVPSPQLRFVACSGNGLIAVGLRVATGIQDAWRVTMSP